MLREKTVLIKCSILYFRGGGGDIGMGWIIWRRAKKCSVGHPYREAENSTGRKKNRKNRRPTAGNTTGEPMSNGWKYNRGTDGPRPMAHGPWPKAHGPWPMAQGPRPKAHGPWPMAQGPRPMAHGPWPMAHGPRPMAQGPWPMAHGPWPKAHGPRPMA